jgi:hypothetical protein
VKKVAAALVGLMLIPVLVGAAASESGSSFSVDTSAVQDIPEDYARLYVQAATRFGFEWQLLAAVGKVECDHGRGDCYRPNSAGAMGPMQFMPATWTAYRTSSRKPPYDVYDANDAIFAAAAKLSADGIKRDPRRAYYSYNHSWQYVDEVVSWALRYGWFSTDSRSLELAVLTHPNIELRPEARVDLEAGLVDVRVVAALLALAAQHRLSAVGPFVTGHAVYVKGTTRVSNHAVGRAVDIPIIDGMAVSLTNEAARDAALLLLELPGELRPDEFGAPWDLPSASVDTFADESHSGHLHAGWSSR